MLDEQLLPEFTWRPMPIHIHSRRDGGCHVKIRTPATGGFNGATWLPLRRRDAPNGYRASGRWRHWNSHLSMSRV